MSTNNTSFDETNFDREIRASLADLRVDREEFAQEVRNKIGEGGAGHDLDMGGGDSGGGGQSTPPIGSFLRRAAGVMPPFFFPKGMAKLGLGAGSAGATKAGLKFVPGLALLPVALVFMTFVTAFMALRRLAMGSGTQTEDPKLAAEEVKSWWRRNAVASLTIVAVLAYMFIRFPAEGTVLFVLASTFAMIAIVGVLTSKGLATRGELASGLGSTTLMTTMVVFQFVAGRDHLSGPFGSGFAIPVLGLTTVILFSFRRRRPNGTISEASIKGTGKGIAVLCGLLFVLTLLRGSDFQAEDVVEWIEQSSAPELAEPSRWYELQATLDHLKRSGAPALDLGKWTEDVHHVLDRAHEGEEFNMLYVLPIQRLGLERPQDNEFWLDDFSREIMLDPTSKGFSFRHDEISLRAHDSLVGLTESQRAVLADRVLGDLPSPERPGALERLLGARSCLLALGHGARVAELGSIAREALLQTWTPTNDGAQGAFPSGPSLQERDSSGQLDKGRLTFVWLSSTSAAVAAMDHFGVPEGIDLLALGAYLQEQSRGDMFRGLDPYVALAVSSLAHLRSLDSYQVQVGAKPSFSILELAIKYRMLLASLLLASFAIGATLRAPVGRD